MRKKKDKFVIVRYLPLFMKVVMVGKVIKFGKKYDPQKQFPETKWGFFYYANCKIEPIVVYDDVSNKHYKNPIRALKRLKWSVFGSDIFDDLELAKVMALVR